MPHWALALVRTVCRMVLMRGHNICFGQRQEKLSQNCPSYPRVLISDPIPIKNIKEMSIHCSFALTLKAAITTAAEDIHKYFFLLFFRENKT